MFEFPRSLNKTVGLVRSHERNAFRLPVALQEVQEAPKRSVVLVDEVDKAPRDFPNDILYEVEDLTFEIPELGGIKFRVSRDPSLQPVLVFTSNSEKNLPDAFLRRCVYYHIPFPDKQRLRRIVETHEGSLAARGDPRLAAAIELFCQIP